MFFSGEDTQRICFVTKLLSRPNLIATLPGGRRKSEPKPSKSYHSVGIELPIKPCQNSRDNPRTVLSNQPGLVAFTGYPAASLAVGEEEKDPRARGALHGSARYEPVCDLGPRAHYPNWALRRSLDFYVTSRIRYHRVRTST